MIKRINEKQREESKKRKEDRNKLDKLIKKLIEQGIINKQDLE